jgi:cysteine desulfurase
MAERRDGAAPSIKGRSGEGALGVRRPVYLDNHATTRTDPSVVEAMLPFFTEHYGNAASVSHRFGWDGEEAVKRAREQVARAIGAESREIVFTSGATLSFHEMS